MLSGIVLVGAGADTPSLAQRVQAGMRSTLDGIKTQGGGDAASPPKGLAAMRARRVKSSQATVTVPPAAALAAWNGGAIVGALPNLADRVLTADAWAAGGDAVVSSKLFGTG